MATYGHEGGGAFNPDQRGAIPEEPAISYQPSRDEFQAWLDWKAKQATPAAPLSLWKLYCTDKVTGEPRRAVVLAATFQEAIALWPDWTGQGSAHCEAGPEAYGDLIKIPIIGITEAPWPGAPEREDPREATILQQAETIGRLDVELAEARFQAGLAKGKA